MTRPPDEPSRRQAIGRGLIAVSAPLVAANTGRLLGDQPDARSTATSDVWASDSLTARQADDLARFWAVCTHFTFDQYSTRLDRVVGLIADAGIRVVRDGWGADFAGATATSQALTGAGIGLAATNSPSDTGGVETEAAVQTMVEAHAARLGTGLVAAEGWNEPGGWRYVLDDDGLRSRVLQWQRWVHAAYRRTPPYQEIPIGGPSLADSNSLEKWRSLDLTAYADRATLHDYLGNAYVLRDGDFDRFRVNGRSMVGSGRIASTETGTSVGQVGAPFAVPDAAAAGVLVPRVQWEHFRRGWELSASYEFLDEGADDGYESKFGLVDHDLRPKPAYDVIKNTLNLLLDPGPQFLPVPLRARLDGTDACTRFVLLQKRDGTYWLAVWQQVQVWNRTFGRVAPVERPVTLQFDRERTVTTFDPHVARSAQNSQRGVTATVLVSEKTLLVQIV